MPSKDLTFRLFGEDATASASLRRLSDNADRASSRMTQSVGKSHAAFAGLVAGVTSAGLGMAGAAIGAGFDIARDAVVGFARTGIGEVMDAATGMAQLQAGIKSTGGVAGVSVSHMEDLAGSLQSMSGQTDDSIVSAEQLLLTFTNIRNHGPDKIFDAATRAATDMAARMGGDASSKAVMLGKALNDPVKGMSALQRVGVSFTRSQKDAVAQMVKTGDTVGAQKVILHELNKEFGGSAKAAGQTMPGQLARLQRGFEDVSQTVVGKMTPGLKPLFRVLGDGMRSVNKFAQSKEFQKWAAGLGKDLSKGLKDMGPSLKKMMPDFKTLAKDLLSSGPTIVRGIKILVDTVATAAKVTHWFVTTEPVLDKWFKNAHNVLVGNDADTKSSMKAWDDLEHSIDDWFTKSHQSLVDFGGTAVSVLTGTDKSTQSSIAAWNDLEGKINDWFNTAHAAIVKFAGDVIGTFSTIGRQMVDGLVGGLQAAWGAVTSTITNLVNAIPAGVRKLLGIASPSKVFHEIGRNIGQGLHNGLLGTKDQIQATANKLADSIVQMFKDKDISKSTESRALAILHAGTRQLEDIAKRRAVVATRLTAAKETLKTALADRKAYGADVKSSTVAAGDVTTLGSAGDMVQRLHDLVAHTKTFRNVLKSLVKKGIDRTTYGELVQAGVAGGGLEAAQSLLANPIDLKQVVSLQKQLASAAGGVGSDTSRYLYQPAITRDIGRVDNLTHVDRALARQQRSVAASTVRRVERTVHVHVNVSGHIVGSQTALAKEVVSAIRAATRSGAISKDALKV